MGYITATIEKWEDIFRLDRYFLSPFIFRGQQNCNWNLETSIERAKKFSIFSSFDFRTEEKWMLHEFSRKYHLYSSRLISLEDKVEWLSVMQHHGAPTRLLDFTDSFFIASYFSVIDSTTDAAIWAINRHVLRDNLLRDYSLPYKKGEALKDEVNRHNTDFANQFIARKFTTDEILPNTVIPLEPYLCSERLSRQQGLFLMPTNSGQSFSKNLETAFGRTNSEFEQIPFEELIKRSNDRSKDFRPQLIKMIVPHALHRDIVNHLCGMNIVSEVLFPGLDGLAKSLIQTQIRR